MLKNSVLVVTGGTGSFGNALVEKVDMSEVKEVRIFSRDEKKQDDMRKKFQNPRLKFYLGDVRDRASLEPVMDGADFVFHAAALKQVPSCEFYPLEALKTNVLGAENVLSVAIDKKIKKVVVLSTDKAVYPINAMGMTKGLMEKVALARSRYSGETIISCTRYGNVMASRGSVIPLFNQLIEDNSPITITDPDMTRFMMSLNDAIELVLYAFQNGKNGDIFVQKAPAASVSCLVEAIKQIYSKPDHETKIIGTRHGEKAHETLVTQEEMLKAEDQGEFYRIPLDSRGLNYESFYEKGKEKLKSVEEYNSANTKQLTVSELKAMLLDLGIYK